MLDLNDIRSTVASKTNRSRQPCAIEWIQEQHPDHYDEIMGLIYDESLSARFLSDELSTSGVDIGYQSINRHRTRSCKRCRDLGRYDQ